VVARVLLALVEPVKLEALRPLARLRLNMVVEVVVDLPLARLVVLVDLRYMEVEPVEVEGALTLLLPFLTLRLEDLALVRL
jgi:hypothetical protein